MSDEEAIREGAEAPETDPLADLAAPADALDKVVLLLVSGMGREKVGAICRGKLGVPAEEVEKLVEAARRRITLAADYNRVEQIGRAVTRLNDLYTRCLAAKDVRAALAALRELNKLMDLYTPAPEEDGAGAAAEDPGAAQARLYLESLGLADLDTTLAELARLAVGEIIRLRSQPPVYQEAPAAQPPR